MQTLRQFLVVILCISACLSPVDGAAQSGYTGVQAAYWTSAEGAFMNMRPGIGTTLNYTIETNSQTNIVGFQITTWVGEFNSGRLYPSLCTSIAPGGETTASISFNYTSEIMAACNLTATTGSLALWYFVSFSLQGGGSATETALFPNTFGCSVDTPVTPVAPTFVARQCGPDNDIINITSQPTGVDLTNTQVTPWNSGNRTITYLHHRDITLRVRQVFP